MAVSGAVECFMVSSDGSEGFGQVKDMHGKTYMTRLRSFISLMRSCGFFFRMIAAVFPIIISSMVVDTISVPDPSVNHCFHIFRLHILYHFRCYVRAYTEPAGDTSEPAGGANQRSEPAGGGKQRPCKAYARLVAAFAQVCC